MLYVRFAIRAPPWYYFLKIVEFYYPFQLPATLKQYFLEKA